MSTGQARLLLEKIDGRLTEAAYQRELLAGQRQLAADMRTYAAREPDPGLNQALLAWAREQDKIVTSMIKKRASGLAADRGPTGPSWLAAGRATHKFCPADTLPGV